MATIQTNKGPSSRSTGGEHVLQAAASLGSKGTKPIEARLAAFKKAHGEYTAANAAVEKADQAVRAQQTKVAELDVTQDERVDDLATTAVADGMPRLSPFKALKFAAPGAIKTMGYVDEANEALSLAAAVTKRKSKMPHSQKAAKALAQAAKAVIAAAKPIEALTKKRKAAISRRDALEQGWEKTFAALKRAARAAADDGHVGLYTALFESSAPKAKTAAKKAKAAKKTKKDSSAPSPA